MIVLAADTSLPVLSVALVDDGVLLAAAALEGKGSRNEKLLPAIDWVLAESGVDKRRVDLFAVTRGPGSFTGVRIGLATIQGLALALGRPVCAMSTHEAIAHGTGGRVVIADDAGRGEFYLSLFLDGVEQAPPHLGSADARDALAAGGRIIGVAGTLQSENVALRCARRAIDLERSGRGDRHRDVTPIYVRLAEAEVKLRQKQDA